ncbi:hypothetical protein [Carboxydothermus ferrireducens]|nr:hypothetical protein [Carboxydothermus ferrireducens]
MSNWSKYQDSYCFITLAIAMQEIGLKHSPAFSSSYWLIGIITT